MGGGKGSGLTYFANGQCHFLTKWRWVGWVVKGGWLVSERTGVVQRAGVGFQQGTSWFRNGAGCRNGDLEWAAVVMSWCWWWFWSGDSGVKWVVVVSEWVMVVRRCHHC